jgi:hypothetical protein
MWSARREWKEDLGIKKWERLMGACWEERKRRGAGARQRGTRWVSCERKDGLLRRMEGGRIDQGMEV